MCIKAKGVKNVGPYDPYNLYMRHKKVLDYFPNAMCVSDFMSRTELALSGFGFTGDNSIAMVNLCRDEVTQVVKDSIECIFGSCFNTNGLGGVLTCGLSGMKAGLSHSPICESGRERYVFFAFPHISISSDDKVGEMTRPGRHGISHACGALHQMLSAFHPDDVNSKQAAEIISRLCKVPGVHDPLEPEYSILKQRLARRIRYESQDASKLDLVSLTKIAERTITNDLEYLIEKAVNPAVSDYAVVTGIQIHNWCSDLSKTGPPSLEFVAPAKFYTVVNGKRTVVNLDMIPPLSPRQLHAIASRTFAGIPPSIIVRGVHGAMLTEIPFEYMSRKLGGSMQNESSGASKPPKESAGKGVIEDLKIEVEDFISPSFVDEIPLWQQQLSSGAREMDRDVNAPNMETSDHSASPSFVNPSF
nr:low-CO2-inducible chloroplast envelope (LIP) [Polytomella parva]|eukprot:CAMPEP_0175045806 /NCGR_PEP_ID=MMETSP0052_2-20121109/4657_1 /TAXON_ID=51329 ORGANISM="Polytomella parva, Strain SAG 63-3" /NCGR_SAMPLE_ID=MMETSP0052_2 /ASSEMBLY_ACC=CAM_ASM_000194 /LENGTH=416 /DNA_ID=CAMNT_0016309437 /DNA_START=211 /DNA_END=1461 /DNA_ORIENTATION=+